MLYADTARYLPAWSCMCAERRVYEGSISMAEHPYHPKRGQPGLRRRVPPALLRKPPVLRTGPGTWVARLLLAGALITTLLVLAGASAAYGADAQLAELAARPPRYPTEAPGLPDLTN